MDGRDDDRERDRRVDGRDDDRERERRLVLFRLVLDLVETAFLLVFFLLFVLLRLLFFLLRLLFVLLVVLLCFLFVLVDVNREREWERERDDAVGVSGVVSSTVDIDRLDEVEWSDEGVAGDSALLDLSGTFGTSGTSGTSTASDASDASDALDTEDTFAYEEERLEDGEDGIGSVRVEE